MNETERSALEALNKKRRRAIELAEENLDKALTDKEFNKLFYESSDLALKIAKANLDKKNADKEKKRYQEVEALKEKALKRINLKKADLVPRYDCALCGDKGFINGKYCSCLRNKINEALINSLPDGKSGAASFKSLDLGVFKNESHKKQIKTLYDKLKEFCDKFPDTKKQNILLAGKTGTGKTHAFKTVANELLNNGFSVFYITAFKLNELMLKYHTTFDDEKTSILESVFGSDLLIIDDLGTEPIFKNVTIEYLLVIYNERLINNKHTLTCTNLDMDSIEKRYDQRIFSRLNDAKTTYKIIIEGDDLRNSK
jgi:DNA replication protein DnaC